MVKKQPLKRLFAATLSLVYLHVNVVYAGMPATVQPSRLFNLFTTASKTPRVLTFHYDSRRLWEEQFKQQQQQQGQDLHSLERPVNQPLNFTVRTGQHEDKAKPFNNEIQSLFKNPQQTLQNLGVPAGDDLKAATEAIGKTTRIDAKAVTVIDHQSGKTEIKIKTAEGNVSVTLQRSGSDVRAQVKVERAPAQQQPQSAQAQPKAPAVKANDPAKAEAAPSVLRAALQKVGVIAGDIVKNKIAEKVGNVKTAVLGAAAALTGILTPAQAPLNPANVAANLPAANLMNMPPQVQTMSDEDFQSALKNAVAAGDLTYDPNANSGRGGYIATIKDQATGRDMKLTLEVRGTNLVVTGVNGRAVDMSNQKATPFIGKFQDAGGRERNLSYGISHFSFSQGWKLEAHAYANIKDGTFKDGNVNKKPEDDGAARPSGTAISRNLVVDVQDNGDVLFRARGSNAQVAFISDISQMNNGSLKGAGFQPITAGAENITVNVGGRTVATAGAQGRLASPTQTYVHSRWNVSDRPQTTLEKATLKHFNIDENSAVLADASGNGVGVASLTGGKLTSIVFSGTAAGHNAIQDVFFTSKKDFQVGGKNHGIEIGLANESGKTAVFVNDKATYQQTVKSLAAAEAQNFDGMADADIRRETKKLFALDMGLSRVNHQQTVQVQGKDAKIIVQSSRETGRPVQIEIATDNYMVARTIWGRNEARAAVVKSEDGIRAEAGSNARNLKFTNPTLISSDNDGNIAHVQWNLTVRGQEQTFTSNFEAGSYKNVSGTVAALSALGIKDAVASATSAENRAQNAVGPAIKPEVSRVTTDGKGGVAQVYLQAEIGGKGEMLIVGIEGTSAKTLNISMDAAKALGMNNANNAGQVAIGGLKNNEHANQNLKTPTADRVSIDENGQIAQVMVEALVNGEVEMLAVNLDNGQYQNTSGDLAVLTAIGVQGADQKVDEARAGMVNKDKFAAADVNNARIETGTTDGQGGISGVHVGMEINGQEKTFVASFDDFGNYANTTGNKADLAAFGIKGTADAETEARTQMVAQSHVDQKAVDAAKVERMTTNGQGGIGAVHVEMNINGLEETAVVSLKDQTYDGFSADKTLLTALGINEVAAAEQKVRTDLVASEGFDQQTVQNAGIDRMSVNRAGTVSAVFVELQVGGKKDTIVAGISDETGNYTGSTGDKNFLKALGISGTAEAETEATAKAVSEDKLDANLIAAAKIDRMTTNGQGGVAAVYLQVQINAQTETLVAGISKETGKYTGVTAEKDVLIAVGVQGVDQAEKTVRAEMKDNEKFDSDAVDNAKVERMSTDGQGKIGAVYVEMNVAGVEGTVVASFDKKDGSYAGATAKKELLLALGVQDASTAEQEVRTKMVTQDKLDAEAVVAAQVEQMTTDGKGGIAAVHVEIRTGGELKTVVASLTDDTKQYAGITGDKETLKQLGLKNVDAAEAEVLASMVETGKVNPETAKTAKVDRMSTDGQGKIGAVYVEMTANGLTETVVAGINSDTGKFAGLTGDKEFLTAIGIQGVAAAETEARTEMVQRDKISQQDAANAKVERMSTDENGQVVGVYMEITKGGKTDTVVANLNDRTGAYAGLSGDKQFLSILGIKGVKQAETKVREGLTMNKNLDAQVVASAKIERMTTDAEGGIGGVNVELTVNGQKYVVLAGFNESGAYNGFTADLETLAALAVGGIEAKEQQAREQMVSADGLNKDAVEAGSAERMSVDPEGNISSVHMQLKSGDKSETVVANFSEQGGYAGVIGDTNFLESLGLNDVDAAVKVAASSLEKTLEGRAQVRDVEVNRIASDGKGGVGLVFVDLTVNGRKETVATSVGLDADQNVVLLGMRMSRDLTMLVKGDDAVRGVEKSAVAGVNAEFEKLIAASGVDGDDAETLAGSQRGDSFFIDANGQLSQVTMKVETPAGFGAVLISLQGDGKYARANADRSAAQYLLGSDVYAYYERGAIGGLVQAAAALFNDMKLPNPFKSNFNLAGFAAMVGDLSSILGGIVAAGSQDFGIWGSLQGEGISTSGTGKLSQMMLSVRLTDGSESSIQVEYDNQQGQWRKAEMERNVAVELVGDSAVQSAEEFGRSFVKGMEGDTTAKKFSLLSGGHSEVQMPLFNNRYGVTITVGWEGSTGHAESYSANHVRTGHMIPMDSESITEENVTQVDGNLIAQALTRIDSLGDSSGEGDLSTQLSKLANSAKFKGTLSSVHYNLSDGQYMVASKGGKDSEAVDYRTGARVSLNMMGIARAKNGLDQASSSEDPEALQSFVDQNGYDRASFKDAEGNTFTVFSSEKYGNGATMMLCLFNNEVRLYSELDHTNPEDAGSVIYERTNVEVIYRGERVQATMVRGNLTAREGEFPLQDLRSQVGTKDIDSYLHGQLRNVGFYGEKLEVVTSEGTRELVALINDQGAGPQLGAYLDRQNGETLWRTADGKVANGGNGLVVHTRDHDTLTQDRIKTVVIRDGKIRDTFLGGQSLAVGTGNLSRTYRTRQVNQMLDVINNFSPQQAVELESYVESIVADRSFDQVLLGEGNVLTDQLGIDQVMIVSDSKEQDTADIKSRRGTQTIYRVDEKRMGGISTAWLATLKTTESNTRFEVVNFDESGLVSHVARSYQNMSEAGVQLVVTARGETKSAFAMLAWDDAEDSEKLGRVESGLSDASLNPEKLERTIQEGYSAWNTTIAQQHWGLSAFNAAGSFGVQGPDGMVGSVYGLMSPSQVSQTNTMVMQQEGGRIVTINYSEDQDGKISQTWTYIGRDGYIEETRSQTGTETEISVFDKTEQKWVGSHTSSDQMVSIDYSAFRYTSPMGLFWDFQVHVKESQVAWVQAGVAGVAGGVIALALTPFTGGLSLLAFAAIVGSAAIVAYQTTENVRLNNGNMYLALAGTIGAILVPLQMLRSGVFSAISAIETGLPRWTSYAVWGVGAVNTGYDTYKYMNGDKSVGVGTLALDYAFTSMPLFSTAFKFLPRLLFKLTGNSWFLRPMSRLIVGAVATSTMGALIGGGLYSYQGKSFTTGMTVGTITGLLLPVAAILTFGRMARLTRISMAYRAPAAVVAGGIAGGALGYGYSDLRDEDAWSGAFLGAMMGAGAAITGIIFGLPVYQVGPATRSYPLVGKALGQLTRDMTNVGIKAVLYGVLPGLANMAYVYWTSDRALTNQDLLGAFVAGAMIGGFARAISVNAANLGLYVVQPGKFYESALHNAVSWSLFGLSGVGSLLPTFDAGQVNPVSGQFMEGQGWIWNPQEVLTMPVAQRLQAAAELFKTGFLMGGFLNAVSFQPNEKSIAGKLVEQGPVGMLGEGLGLTRLMNNPRSWTAWGNSMARSVTFGVTLAAAHEVWDHGFAFDQWNMNNIYIGAGIGFALPLLAAGIRFSAAPALRKALVDRGVTNVPVDYAFSVKRGMGALGQLAEVSQQKGTLGGWFGNWSVHTYLAGAEGLMPLHAISQAGAWGGFALGRAMGYDNVGAVHLSQTFSHIAMFLAPMPTFRGNFVREVVASGRDFRLLGDIVRAGKEGEFEYGGVPFKAGEGALFEMALRKTAEVISANPDAMRTLNNYDFASDARSSEEGVPRLVELADFEALGEARFHLAELVFTPDVQILVAAHVVNYLGTQGVSAVQIYESAEGADFAGFNVTTNMRKLALNAVFNDIAVAVHGDANFGGAEHAQDRIELFDRLASGYGRVSDMLSGARFAELRTSMGAAADLRIDASIANQFRGLARGEANGLVSRLLRAGAGEPGIEVAFAPTASETLYSAASQRLALTIMKAGLESPGAFLQMVRTNDYSSLGGRAPRTFGEAFQQAYGRELPAALRPYAELNLGNLARRASVSGGTRSTSATLDLARTVFDPKPSKPLDWNPGQEEAVGHAGIDGNSMAVWMDVGGGKSFLLAAAIVARNRGDVDIFVINATEKGKYLNDAVRGARKGSYREFIESSGRTVYDMDEIVSRMHAGDMDARLEFQIAMQDQNGVRFWTAQSYGHTRTHATMELMKMKNEAGAETGETLTVRDLMIGAANRSGRMVAYDEVHRQLLDQVEYIIGDVGAKLRDSNISNKDRASFENASRLAAGETVDGQSLRYVDPTEFEALPQTEKAWTYRAGEKVYLKEAAQKVAEETGIPSSFLEEALRAYGEKKSGFQGYTAADDADGVKIVVPMGGGKAEVDRYFQSLAYAYAAAKAEGLNPLDAVRVGRTEASTSGSNLFETAGQIVGLSGTLDGVRAMSEAYGMEVTPYGEFKDFEYVSGAAQPRSQQIEMLVVDRTDIDALAKLIADRIDRGYEVNNRNQLFNTADVNLYAKVREIMLARHGKNGFLEIGPDTPDNVVNGMVVQLNGKVRLIGNTRSGIGLDYKGNWDLIADAEGNSASYMRQDFGRVGRNPFAETWTRTAIFGKQSLEATVTEATKGQLLDWVGAALIMKAELLQTVSENGAWLGKYEFKEPLTRLDENDVIVPVLRADGRPVENVSSSATSLYGDMARSLGERMRSGDLDIHRLSDAEKALLTTEYNEMKQASSALKHGLSNTLRDKFIVRIISDLVIKAGGKDTALGGKIYEVLDDVLNGRTRETTWHSGRGEVREGFDQLTETFGNLRKEAINNVFGRLRGVLEGRSGSEEILQIVDNMLGQWNSARVDTVASQRLRSGTIDGRKIALSDSVQDGINRLFSFSEELVPDFGSASTSSAPKSVLDLRIAAARSSTDISRAVEQLEADTSLARTDGNLTARGRAVAAAILITAGMNDEDRDRLNSATSRIMAGRSGAAALPRTDDIFDYALALSGTLALSIYGGQYEALNIPKTVHLLLDLDAVLASDVQFALLSSSIVSDDVSFDSTQLYHTHSAREGLTRREFLGLLHADDYSAEMERFIATQDNEFGRGIISDQINLSPIRERVERRDRIANDDRHFQANNLVKTGNGVTRPRYASFAARILWQTVSGQAGFYSWSDRGRQAREPKQKSIEILRDMARGNAPMAAALTSILLGGVDPAVNRTFARVFEHVGAGLIDGNRLQLNDLKLLAGQNNYVGLMQLYDKFAGPGEQTSRKWFTPVQMALGVGAIFIGGLAMSWGWTALLVTPVLTIVLKQVTARTAAKKESTASAKTPFYSKVLGAVGGMISYIPGQRSKELGAKLAGLQAPEGSKLLIGSLFALTPLILAASFPATFTAVTAAVLGFIPFLGSTLVANATAAAFIKMSAPVALGVIAYAALPVAMRVAGQPIVDRFGFQSPEQREVRYTARAILSHPKVQAYLKEVESSDLMRTIKPPPEITLGDVASMAEALKPYLAPRTAPVATPPPADDTTDSSTGGRFSFVRVFVRVSAAIIPTVMLMGANGPTDSVALPSLMAFVPANMSLITTVATLLVTALSFFYMQAQLRLRPIELNEKRGITQEDHLARELVVKEFVPTWNNDTTANLNRTRDRIYDALPAGVSFREAEAWISNLAVGTAGDQDKLNKAVDNLLILFESAKNDPALGRQALALPVTPLSAAEFNPALSGRTMRVKAALEQVDVKKQEAREDMRQRGYSAQDIARYEPLIDRDVKRQIFAQYGVTAAEIAVQQKLDRVEADITIEDLSAIVDQTAQEHRLVLRADVESLRAYAFGALGVDLKAYYKVNAEIKALVSPSLGTNLILLKQLKALPVSLFKGKPTMELLLASREGLGGLIAELTLAAWKSNDPSLNLEQLDREVAAFLGVMSDKDLRKARQTFEAKTAELGLAIPKFEEGKKSIADVQLLRVSYAFAEAKQALAKNKGAANDFLNALAQGDSAAAQEVLAQNEAEVSPLTQRTLLPEGAATPTAQVKDKAGVLLVESTEDLAQLETEEVKKAASILSTLQKDGKKATLGEVIAAVEADASIEADKKKDLIRAIMILDGIDGERADDLLALYGDESSADKLKLLLNFSLEDLSDASNEMETLYAVGGYEAWLGDRPVTRQTMEEYEGALDEVKVYSYYAHLGRPVEKAERQLIDRIIVQRQAVEGHLNVTAAPGTRRNYIGDAAADLNSSKVHTRLATAVGEMTPEIKEAALKLAASQDAMLNDIYKAVMQALGPQADRAQVLALLQKIRESSSAHEVRGDLRRVLALSDYVTNPAKTSTFRRVLQALEHSYYSEVKIGQAGFNSNGTPRSNEQMNMLVHVALPVAAVQEQTGFSGTRWTRTALVYQAASVVNAQGALQIVPNSNGWTIYQVSREKNSIVQVPLVRVTSNGQTIELRHPKWTKNIVTLTLDANRAISRIEANPDGRAIVQIAVPGKGNVWSRVGRAPINEQAGVQTFRFANQAEYPRSRAYTEIPNSTFRVPAHLVKEPVKKPAAPVAPVAAPVAAQVIEDGEAIVAAPQAVPGLESLELIAGESTGVTLLPQVPELDSTVVGPAKIFRGLLDQTYEYDFNGSFALAILMDTEEMLAHYPVEASPSAQSNFMVVRSGSGEIIGVAISTQKMDGNWSGADVMGAEPQFRRMSVSEVVANGTPEFYYFERGRLYRTELPSDPLQSTSIVARSGFTVVETALAISGTAWLMGMAAAGLKAGLAGGMAAVLPAVGSVALLGGAIAAVIGVAFYAGNQISGTRSLSALPIVPTPSADAGFVKQGSVYLAPAVQTVQYKGQEALVIQSIASTTDEQGAAAYVIGANFSEPVDALTLEHSAPQATPAMKAMIAGLGEIRVAMGQNTDEFPSTSVDAMMVEFMAGPLGDMAGDIQLTSILNNLTPVETTALAQIKQDNPALDVTQFDTLSDVATAPDDFQALARFVVASRSEALATEDSVVVPENVNSFFINQYGVFTYQQVERGAGRPFVSVADALAISQHNAQMEQEIGLTEPVFGIISTDQHSFTGPLSADRVNAREADDLPNIGARQTAIAQSSGDNVVVTAWQKLSGGLRNVFGVIVNVFAGNDQSQTFLVEGNQALADAALQLAESTMNLTPQQNFEIWTMVADLAAGRMQEAEVPGFKFRDFVVVLGREIGKLRETNAGTFAFVQNNLMPRVGARFHEYLRVAAVPGAGSIMNNPAKNYVLAQVNESLRADLMTSAEARAMLAQVEQDAADLTYDDLAGPLAALYPSQNVLEPVVRASAARHGVPEFTVYAYQSALADPMIFNALSNAEQSVVLEVAARGLGRLMAQEARVSLTEGLARSIDSLQFNVVPMSALAPEILGQAGYDPESGLVRIGLPVGADPRSVLAAAIIRVAHEVGHLVQDARRGENHGRLGSPIAEDEAEIFDWAKRVFERTGMYSAAVLMTRENVQEVAKQNERRFVVAYYADMKDNFNRWAKAAYARAAATRGNDISAVAVDTAAELAEVKGRLAEMGIDLPVALQSDISSVRRLAKETPVEAFARRWYGAEKTRVLAADPRHVAALITGSHGPIIDLCLNMTTIGLDISAIFNEKYWATIHSQA